MAPHTDKSNQLTRRRILAAAGVAGIGAITGCNADGDGTETPTGTDTTTAGKTETPTPSEPSSELLQPSDVPRIEPGDSHHPGPPRFTSVGAEPLGELLHGPGTDTNLSPLDVELSGVDGDLAPFDPDRDADYAWSIAEAPAASEADLGDTSVVHFEPDVPGEYRLEMDGPDETCELTVRAFPKEDEDDPQPRVTLSAELNEDGDQFIVEADARPSPDSDNAVEDLDVEFYVDDRDRDALDDPGLLVPSSVSGTSHTATVPVEAVTETVRIHAVAVDDRHSVADFVRLEPDGSTAHPNDPPEWIEDATIYEIFVRRFDDEVTFETIESRLDYLEELGVDALWLTPVLDAHSHRDETQPGGPHGYDVIDYYETADDLGSTEDFEALVEAAHERDIRVIFDLVINHTAREHPYFQAAKHDRNVAEDDQEFFRGLYEWAYGDTALTYAYWQGIPVVDYDSLALRSWLLDVVDHWQGIVDGFRCDVAWGVPRSFWMNVRDRVKARDEDFLLLDETVPWHSDLAENQFDAHFDYGFNETLRAIGRGEADATAVNDVLDDRATEGYPGHTAFLNYVENHDMERYLSIGDRDSQMAAGAATFTLPGAPMLYYGQETGVADQRGTMNWDDVDEELTAYYENLIAARDSLSELASDAPTTPIELDDQPDGVVAYARGSEDGQVLVVLNFGGDAATVSLPAGVETTDLLTDIDVSDGDGVSVEHAVVLRADRAEL
ncbi:alpha-amylase family glycosyl hydrolase [Halapricum hydrolyticum]|uniref:Alpha-amylase family glycosyl hydrolase n=1 Tax=Halapricum hydrolyticum TaxID=2979991 RepID=A0AAE3IEN9_9EURY|nr:alpha-amylase family glycosyl hydrolase [Halapricum hydrolyticum]MCU4717816.1 alpha-amylase family glycosyl hydrolase [Halapricum hydrolyticum]MCU4726980.1 alpha-amylase family glycosyl hydrolase [Halapricum hydrolyticum]